MRVFEADRYRVRRIVVASDLPAVWLAGKDEPPVTAAIEQMRGCVWLNAVLRRGTPGWISHQEFTAFVGEAATAADAHTLAAAATDHGHTWHEGIGAASGSLVCVVVARGWPEGGYAAFEGPGALQRFVEPLEAALARSA